MTLTPEHLARLEASMKPEIFEDIGVYSATTTAELPPGFSGFPDTVLPAICFRWHYAGGGELWQVRVSPEYEEEHGDKYLTQPGSLMPLGVHPRMRERVENPDLPILIQEGTKGYLAATSALDGLPIAVVGITGCWGWSHDGLPVPDFNAVPWNGRVVYLSVDADRATNRQVFDGVKMLSEVVLARSAGAVKYVALPTNGTKSIDDYLATFPPEDREAAIQGLLDRATEKIGRAPARPRPKRGRFFDDFGGLLVDALARHLREHHPVALAGDATIAVYDPETGVYRKNPHLFTYTVAEALGDDFRRTHLKDVEAVLAGQLAQEGLVLPTRTTEPVLNVVNGMLDLATGDLLPHDPKYLSHQQIPVPWDEFAGCPAYEGWAKFIVGPPLDDLEETMATMLDQSRTPPKAALLHGPSRSGKSTFLRLMTAIAGPGNTSAVTLHQLSEDRFASANLYGKLLNVAADISADHVRDLSLWKMLTGEDVAQANRKYGAQFSFTNTALMAFSCNVVPTVGEGSNAYLERIKPFLFGHSYAGAEDHTIELAMYEELPGILVRLVKAFQRLRARGRYMPTDPVEARRFEDASNRVRRWVNHEMEVIPVHAPGAVVPADVAMTRTELHRAFNAAAERDGEPRIGLWKFGEHIMNIPLVAEVRRLPDKIRALNIIPRKEEEPPDGWVAHSNCPEAVHTSNMPPQKTSSESVSDDSGSYSPPLHVRREQGSGEGDEVSHVYRQGGQKPPLCHLAPGADFVAFDLETAGADETWSYGPGYVRLIGYRNGAGLETTTDPGVILGLAAAGVTLVGHNVYGYDLPVLAHHHGLDLTTVSAIDTKLLATLADPPEARMKSGEIERYYSLDAVGHRLLGDGKTGDLKALAKEFGGFDRIPVDDPRYVEYVKGDVDVSARLAERFLPMNHYAQREHEVARLAAVIMLNGFRVDEQLLAQRLAAGEATRAEMLERLASCGLPTTKKDGKPCKSPHATQDGKAAIVTAFAELGVRLPRTKSDQPALGSDAMDGVAAKHPQARALAETVKSLFGIRTIYETVTTNLHDGRVHPAIDFRQASGRWSVTKPGLTVMGKRGGRHVEREIFLAEPGHVIISADLSQVDARAVAVHSQDPAYLSLFEPGMDAHAEIARRIWSDPTRREEGKALGHGFNYGEGPARIAREAGVTFDEASAFHRAMCEQFPLVVDWQNQVREIGDAGELLDNGFGRRMRVTSGRSYTQAPALVGQGCARDLMMEGLLRLDRSIWPMLRAVVHDEVVLSVPLDVVDDVEQEVVRALSFEWAPPGKSRTVQVTAGLVGRGPSWGSIYEKGA